MDQDRKKQNAAEASLNYIENGTVLGVGTGSTVNYLIDIALLPEQTANEVKDLAETWRTSILQRMRRTWYAPPPPPPPPPRSL